MTDPSMWHAINKGLFMSNFTVSLSGSGTISHGSAVTWVLQGTGGRNVLRKRYLLFVPDGRTKAEDLWIRALVRACRNPSLSLLDLANQMAAVILKKSPWQSYIQQC